MGGRGTRGGVRWRGEGIAHRAVAVSILVKHSQGRLAHPSWTDSLC
jgi:hypothetical protein